MQRFELLAAVTEVAVETLAVTPGSVTEQARFSEDLDADSLDLVEFVMALEERFGVSIAEDELEGVTTIGQALDLVSDRLAAKA